MIDGQLWCHGGNYVDIFSTDLEKLRTIELSDISEINDLADIKGDMVVVACDDGLFLMDKKGK